MSKGFVYVLTNRAMPGLVKVGFTVKVPTERAAELSTTGVPTPFEVEYYCLTQDPAALEARAHVKLSSVRQSEDREFFRATVFEAIEAIKSEAVEVEHSWQRLSAGGPRPQRVACGKCGASYVSAEYCPKCRIKLAW